jgi:hypothetical protein
MKKVLRIKSGESLHGWCVRLSKHYGGKAIKEDELLELLREVSIKSYVHGSNDAIEAIKNPLRRL